MLNAFSVIAETPQFWVLNKAAGVSFHSEQGPGLVAQAEAQFAEKLYAVHRLDKVTSGLLILARQPAVAAALTQLFASRQITKCYLALSAAKPQKKQGWVKGAMQPARRGAWRLAETGAAPAVTYFVSQGYQDAPFRAFLLRPYTGKTHQLRVALKSVGAPILGDSLYGGAAADRVYLHACALSLVYLASIISISAGQIMVRIFNSYSKWGCQLLGRTRLVYPGQRHPFWLWLMQSRISNVRLSNPFCRYRPVVWSKSLAAFSAGACGCDWYWWGR